MKLEEIFETNNISEDTEAAFQFAFKRVVDKLGFQYSQPAFDSSSTEYGVKQFFNADKILLSLLPEDDDDFIGIIGRNRENFFYVDKSGKAKTINEPVAKKIINRANPDGVGIMNV